MSETLSRREFLKIAGVAGAAVGMGAGLGGLLAACGEEEETTTTTAGATTTTAGATTTTAGATTTSVSAEPEVGREIKLGFVAPLTGPLASFGVPDTYCVDRWKEAVGEGMVLGDGMKHPISITIQDSQSDSNRAAQVAGDLINNTGIDLMMVASTPDTVKPTVDQCEANSTPCVSTDCPWQTYLGDAFSTGYKWSYHVFFGGEDWMEVNVKCYDQIPTSKTVGYMLPNDADGNYYREVYPGFLEKNGYKPVDGGAYQNGTEDYSSIISLFKSEGVEISHRGHDPARLHQLLETVHSTRIPAQSIPCGQSPAVPAVGRRGR